MPAAGAHSAKWIPVLREKYAQPVGSEHFFLGADRNPPGRNMLL
jgi:hypothetical protein